jgi:hypothetical protein
MGCSGAASEISRVLAVCVCLAPLAVCAQGPSQQELQKIARNPFADVIKLPLEPDIYFDAGLLHRTAGDLEIEPLFPIQISKGWLLIPRIVATAVTYVPDLTRETGGKLGLGDIVPTFFFTPTHVSRLIWGVGPALLIPTATDKKLGDGKWGLGPSFVVESLPKWGSAEILVQNIWSIAGTTKRGPVNRLELEPSFSYNLSDEWYLATGPTITADWTQVLSDRWLVPVGGGVGRTFKLGRRPVDANVTIYRNVVRPASQLSPRWQLSLEVTLLFTKHR